MATKRTGKTSATTRKRTATRRGKAPARRRGAAAPIKDTPESSNGSERGTSLIIVESPAKAKTIGKYLGRGYRVKATVGHVRDLPTKKLGVDIEHGFAPQYVTIEGKEKTLAELAAAAKDSTEV